MEESTVVQDQIETSAMPVDSGNDRRRRGFIPTLTLVLGLINIIVGMVVDFVLEFRSNFSTFWTECLVLALIGLVVLSLRSSRGVVVLALNAGIFCYLWFVHVSPFLFGP